VGRDQQPEYQPNEQQSFIHGINSFRHELYKT
jgi:hypothetical protein